VVGDTSALKRFSDGIDGTLKNVINLKNALGLMTLYGMERFVSSTVDGYVALSNLNQQTGLSIEMMRKWQIAGQMANLAMSAEEVSGSIASLQKNLTAIRLGGGNVRPFQLLGVDILGKNAFQVLESLRGAVKGMNRPMATNLLEQAGLNANFINLLTKSKEEFEALARVPFLNKDQRAKVMALGQELKLLKLNLSSIKDLLVANFQPVFSAIIQVIGHAAQAFSWLTASISKSKEALGILKVALAAIMISLFPLTSAMTALLLIMDDIASYMEGKESYTGDILKWMGYDEKSKKFKEGEGSNIFGRSLNKIQDVNKEMEQEAMKRGISPEEYKKATSFTNTFNFYGLKGLKEDAEAVGEFITQKLKSAMMEIPGK
jgi:hypothetical protein